MPWTVYKQCLIIKNNLTDRHRYIDRRCLCVLMKSVQIDLDSVEVGRAEKVKGNHTWKEILMMGIEVLEAE